MKLFLKWFLARPVFAATTNFSRISGENVLRDLILDRRYSQDGGHNQGNRDSARFREIEKGTNILGAVDRTKFYKRYMIQHTVPRFNNPTGTFDNDQYVYEIFIKSTDTDLIGEMDALMTRIEALANDVKNMVKIEAPDA